jgi:Bardet-Biedl syndrome 9 protein
MLRIFWPRQRDYNVQDLMLEHALGQPIVQVSVGRFAPTSQGSGLDWALAVLQPRRLGVYSVVVRDETYALNLLYEHSFERTAANFCYGPFSQQVGGRGAGGPGMMGAAAPDELCVQSMDGCLHFFRQEVASFHRFLPGALLPGPLLYVPTLGAFVTGSSQMLVSCYKQQALAASTEEKVANVPLKTASDSGASGKRVRATWEANVGEHVLEVRVARWSQGLGAGQVDILVLGEHTLFCLSDEGEIRMQKRLDYPPSCVYPFPLSPGSGAGYQQQQLDSRGGAGLDAAGPTDSLLVASAAPARAFVYSSEKLEWVCGMQSVPVAMEVCEFGGLQVGELCCRAVRVHPLPARLPACRQPLAVLAPCCLPWPSAAGRVSPSLSHTEGGD